MYSQFMMHGQKIIKIYNGDVLLNVTQVVHIFTTGL